jgi:lactate racemase
VAYVELAYGAGTLGLEVPEGTTVIEPRALPPMADPVGALRAALAPVVEAARGARRVAIAFPDNTRPMPSALVLPVVLAELESVGVGPEEVVLCCATGAHAELGPAALAELVGPEVAERYEVHCHRATDVDHVEVGRVDGVPILLDRRWADAELRLTTGFVEPHFFAGFSGGPKGVCPGLAGLETILEAHSIERIADPGATWLELEANPVHRFVSAAAALCPPDASLDVALSLGKQLAAVFVGPLPGAHRAACAEVHRHAVARVREPFDVVVATNSGLPLDRNLYQAVKGMAAAERCVVAGGDVLLVASCIDGVPTASPFDQALRAASSPAELRHPSGAGVPELWQTQVLGRVLEHARVHLFSEGVSAEEARRAQLVPVDDLQAHLDELLAAHGPSARLGVLPQGPLSVVEVAS